MQEFVKIFRSLPDPRTPNALHELLDILVIALAAVLCGAKCATDMELFGRSKEKLLLQFLRLEHGIPSHDTFSRVFRTLDPEAFERTFRQFMATFAKANGIKLTGVVAVDGKAVRGAYERQQEQHPAANGQCFCHGSADGAGLAQGARSQRGAGSLGNTADVVARRLHCYGRRAALQPALRHDGARARRPLRAGAQAEPEQAVQAVERRFARAGSGKPADKPVARYYLLSKYMPAKRLLQTARAHWGIENRLHWVLDVVLNEDRGRARKDNAPENLAVLRRLAINIIRAHPARISMRQKVKRAGWDDAFLLDLLSHMR